MPSLCQLALLHVSRYVVRFLSLRLFFCRPRLLLPETCSLSDFAHMWLCSRLKQWPNHFIVLFSRKVSTGFTCASFLMSSFLMWSNLVFPLGHFYFFLIFLLYGPTFRVVCHCWLYYVEHVAFGVLREFYAETYTAPLSLIALHELRHDWTDIEKSTINSFVRHYMEMVFMCLFLDK